MRITGYRATISLLVALQSTFAILPVFAADSNKPAAADAAADSSDSKDEPDPKVAEANTVSQIGAALSLKLKELENHFFGHLYITEPVNRRITRLERFVFGTESGGPYATRIEHVAGSLSISDPDGVKRTISIEPKAAPPPQSAQDNAPQPNAAAPAIPANADNTGAQSDEQISSASSVKTPADLQALAAAGVAKASAPPPPQVNERPGMEVAPVVNSKTRKVAEISTSVMPDRPGGGLTLQVNKAYFVIAGKPEQMIKELDIAIRVHPSDPELMFERGKAYIQMEKLNNAVNDLSDAILGQPNKSAYYVARAWCYKKLGNSFLAADDIKQAHFVDPALPPQVELLTDTK